jgi:hypothetical protein
MVVKKAKTYYMAPQIGKIQFFGGSGGRKPKS